MRTLRWVGAEDRSGAVFREALQGARSVPYRDQPARGQESVEAVRWLRGNETTGQVEKGPRTDKVQVVSGAHARKGNPGRHRARSRKRARSAMHILAAGGESCRWRRTCQADGVRHPRWRERGLRRWQGGPSRSGLWPAPGCRVIYGEGDSRGRRGFGRARGPRAPACDGQVTVVHRVEGAAEETYAHGDSPA
jgi:hypothetical protein